MEKVKVNKVFRDQLVTKYGPRTKTSIYADGHEGKMSTFDRNEIKEGDEVEITIEKNGQFTNFKIGNGAKKPWSGGASNGSNLEGRVASLEQRVSALEGGEDKVIDDFS